MPKPRRFALVLSLVPLACAALRAGEQEVVDSGPYRDEGALATALADLAASRADAVSLGSIGASRGGRPIHLLEVAAPGRVPPGERPAILLVAGLDGGHLVGTEVAIEAVKALLAAPPEDEAIRRLLEEKTLYVVPRANPDGAAARFESPLRERAGNGRPRDDDRDGRVDEDGPNDLDGDGVLVRMRVPDPEGTFVADEVDPRLLREADALKGERGTWKVMDEGTDDDDDGEANEDPPGDARPHLNFPHGFAEHSADGGAHAASEIEARALLDFCLSHPNLAAVLAWGPQDNLVETPAEGDTEKGVGAGEEGFPFGGTAPVTKLLADDLPIVREIGERYREITGSKAKGEAAVAGGTFSGWSYFHRGIPSFAATLWTPPLDTGTETKPAQPDSKPASKRDSKEEKELEEERKRLRWNDEALGGEGFVAWHEVAHPEHGTVEVGGWRPFVRRNPPPSEIAPLGEPQARFLAALGDSLPAVRLAEVKVEPRGEGVYAIEASVENVGRFPTATAMARRNRALPPVRVRIDLGERARLLAGERQTLVPWLRGGGGRETVRWVVGARAGDEGSVEVWTLHAGRDARAIRFE
jgi:hypothetical protein